MKRYDEGFSKFAQTYSISGHYDPKNINFDCLRESIDFYEAKCGRFSDYGLGYIKYIAQACETNKAS